MKHGCCLLEKQTMQLRNKIYKNGTAMKNLSRNFLLVASLLITPLLAAREIALTFDDAPTPDSALMMGQERTQRLIDVLIAAKIPDALFFVKADYINGDTQKRLEQYAAAGFHLANHS